MQAELIVLRVLHIFTGVFWAGGVFYIAFFVFPAVNALGADGSKFMQQLTRTRSMPTLMSVAGITNVIVGLRLMQIMSGNFQAAWFQSNHGIAITVGAITAIGALTIGLFLNRPRANRIAAIGAAIAASGGTPTPEQIQELGKLKKKLETGVKVMAWHLLVTVLLMSCARYL